MGPGALRALKVAVVAMGVVIVVGTGALVVAIVQRVTHSHLGRVPVAQVPAVTVPTGRVPPSVVLDEPAGTHIVGVAADGKGLAVTLVGGGPDRVVVLDGALRVVGRIALAR